MPEKEKPREQWGICKKTGSCNLGRLFSSLVHGVTFEKIPNSFKWRDEVSILDLVPYDGCTKAGRPFREMRTPCGKAVSGLREYLDL